MSLTGWGIRRKSSCLEAHRRLLHRAQTLLAVCHAKRHKDAHEQPEPHVAELRGWGHTAGAGQLGRDPMQTLQAAASALFRQLIKPDQTQENDEQVGLGCCLSVLDK